MTTTLEMAVQAARRRRQVYAEDVREWARIDRSRPASASSAGTSEDGVATNAAVLGRVVRDVIANFDWMRDIDRLFRQSAGNHRPNPDAAARATSLAGEFAHYAVVARATLRSVASLPPAHQPPGDLLADLERRGTEADELSAAYEGE